MKNANERQLVGKQPTFRPARAGPNFFRIMLWISLLLVMVWLILNYQKGQIKSPFKSTSTPTRLAASYFNEAEAWTSAGKLDDPITATPNPDGSTGLYINDAIDAYKAALAIDKNNARGWADLARIQAYSSSMLRNDSERLARLKEAKANADKALDLAPEDSNVRAIRAFVMDWYAFTPLVKAAEREALLIEAEREASRAYQLDPENALALAYYAEILADQQKWTQAEKYAAQAVTLDPTLMDTHRAYGYVLETLGKYNSAIQQYQEAARINPNMTFLYLRIGQNFREGIRNPDRALDYFDRAAKINEQLGVKNPQPYIEIARTYTQIGQFFVASVNAEKALTFDPTNANTYGQLGVIFRRARNYEGAMSLLKCAVRGCTAEENEMGGVAVEGLPLTSITVAYYYVEYGTNLAFLSRPNENYCPDAYTVLNEVRTVYGYDPTLMSIIEDSEGICRQLFSTPASTAATASTPMPTISATPTPPLTPQP